MVGREARLSFMNDFVGARKEMVVKLKGLGLFGQLVARHPEGVVMGVIGPVSVEVCARTELVVQSKCRRSRKRLELARAGLDEGASPVSLKTATLALCAMELGKERRRSKIMVFFKRTVDGKTVDNTTMRLVRRVRQSALIVYAGWISGISGGRRCGKAGIDQMGHSDASVCDFNALDISFDDLLCELGPSSPFGIGTSSSGLSLARRAAVFVRERMGALHGKPWFKKNERKKTGALKSERGRWWKRSTKRSGQRGTSLDRSRQIRVANHAHVYLYCRKQEKGLPL